MAGIYLHIPFCKQACYYCNFHFSTSLKLKNDFLEALLKEIALQKNYLQDEEVSTVYFGGGTPSLLSDRELQTILQALHQYYPVGAGAEITLEANPDDIDRAKLKAWKAAGINRLSIGIQSFFDTDLQWMNRAHTAGQAIDCIKAAQDTGIDNISIDLIYGTPTLNDENWQQNVERAVQLNIPHLSCYALTVEENTALDSFIKKNKVQPVNTEDQARQFLHLIDWSGKAGYEHYEISNFAMPGKRSRHNSSYWSLQHYLGLGPSAHSYNEQSRQWNVANNALYIQSIQNNTIPYEREVLTETQKLNEYIMTSLRTIEGVDLEYLATRFGPEEKGKLYTGAQPYINMGKLLLNNGKLILTNEGKLFADGIAAALFTEEKPEQ